MDNSVEYKLMCLNSKELQEKWHPKMGDYMVCKTSYCYNQNICTKDDPCSECLEMCNTYVISGTFKYHESVGGQHWYFGGGGCNNNGGNSLNDTYCFIMTESGKSDQANEFYTSRKDDKLWLPRQDQIQDIFLAGCTDVCKIKLFNEFINSGNISYNSHNTSLEQLWLMFYMYEKYNKIWNETSNIKKWKVI